MDTLFSVNVMLESIPILLEYLPVTLQIFFFASLLGILGGIALALVRIYRVPLLNGFAVFMVSYTRGVPIFVQLSWYIIFSLPFLPALSY